MTLPVHRVCGSGQKPLAVRVVQHGEGRADFALDVSVSYDLSLYFSCTFHVLSPYFPCTFHALSTCCPWPQASLFLNAFMLNPSELSVNSRGKP